MMKKLISSTRKHRRRHDALPASLVREKNLQIYSFLVFIVVFLNVSAIFLPHDNKLALDGLEMNPGEIFNQKSVVVLIIVFMAIIIVQRLIIYSRWQQIRYMDARKENLDTNEFLTTVSHDIRTPINSILGLNTIIGRKNQNPEIENYVFQIQRAGDNLLSNLDEILDFSKIEQNTIEIVDNPYDVSKLIGDCYNLMKDRATQKHLDLVVQNDPSTPRSLYGDAVRIRQVIVNILSNAVKYTAEGSVRMDVYYDRLSDKEIHLNIAIEDTGIGIEPQEMSHVFDAYSRIDVYRIRNVEGTGLGMAITKELVERMGGRIMVNSEVNQGTTFRVRIPQRIVDNRPMGTFEPSAGAPALPKNEWFFAPGVRVLVVDDVDMNRRVLTEMMEPSGIWVETARSGAECLQKCLEEKYDVILLDDQMPGMSGVLCFQQLRNQPEGKNRNTPVMMVTANAVRGAAEYYLGLGFTTYLAKPIYEEELIFDLRYLLKGKFLDNK